MGDRADIAIIPTVGQEVHLYTHWGGHRALLSLAKTLGAGFGDFDYFTRRLHANLVADGISDADGDPWLLGFELIGSYQEGDPDIADAQQAVLDLFADSIGYGISPTHTDTEYPRVAVTRFDGQTVIVFAQRNSDGWEYETRMTVSEFLAAVDEIRSAGSHRPYELWRIAHRQLADAGSRRLTVV